MYEDEKVKWVALIEVYKGMTMLWDPKHKDYANHVVRNEAYEKLLELYKKIDSKGTLSQMKKKMANLRNAFYKERRKKLKLMQKGEDYTPSLWYYKHFNFLGYRKAPNNATNGDMHRFNRYDNILYLETGPPATKSRKRKIPNDKANRSSMENIMELEDNIIELSEEEDSTETTTQQAPSTETFFEDSTETTTQQAPSTETFFQDSTETTTQQAPSTDPLYILLEKQTKLIGSASRILTRKEESSEVIGKSIGIQLEKLEEKQQVIAHKLISDVLYYGGMGKLTAESLVNVDGKAHMSESNNVVKEQIDYLEPEFAEYLENE